MSVVSAVYSAGAAENESSNSSVTGWMVSCTVY